MVFWEFLYHVSSICVLNFMRKHHRLIFICEFIRELTNLSTGQFCALCVVKFTINSTWGILRLILHRMKDNTLEVNLEKNVQ